MSVAVVIVAAGDGTRLGADIPKAFVPLAGEPILSWALTQALACPEVGHVVMVVPASYLAYGRALVPAHEAGRVDVVPGGADRTESVARGLESLHPEDGIVLVHDAARPLAPAALFSAVVAAVRQGHGAVVPGLPVPDTVKQVDPDGHVVATPERSSLRAVQTPQGFVREILSHAHAHARRPASDVGATDDAALVERSGAPVFVIDGDPVAMKITTAADLAYAGWLIEADGGRQHQS